VKRTSHNRWIKGAPGSGAVVVFDTVAAAIVSRFGEFVRGMVLGFYEIMK